MSIEDQVKSIIVEHLSVDPEQATSEASFVDDLGADSLDLAELVILFEQSFDIRIPPASARELRSVGSAIAYIQSTRAADPS